DQAEELKSRKDELNGSAFDDLLLGELRISSHQLNVAKAKTYGVCPINVKRVAINKGTWEVLDQDFCTSNHVVPVSCFGKFIVVALSNPFELTLTTRIAEITNKQVIALLAPEADLKEVLKQDQKREETQF